MVSGAGEAGAGLQQSSSRTYLEYTQGRQRTVRVDIHSRRLMMALPPSREMDIPANLVLLMRLGSRLHGRTRASCGDAADRSAPSLVDQCGSERGIERKRELSHER